MAGDDRGYDVAVVGAGIVGASTAYWLARAGARVALLDAGRAGEGASGSSFAWLNSEHKEPDAYHRLNAAGMVEWTGLEGAVAEINVHRSGMLHWPTTEAEDALLAAWCDRLQRLGYAARWITREECAEREPGLRLPSAAARVLALEDDAWVDPPAVIRALLAAARDRVTLYEQAEVTAIRYAGDAVAGISAGERRLAVDALVVCAGTGTAGLTELLGFPVPVERRPGLLVVTSPMAGAALRHIVHQGLAEHDLHLRPDPTGGIRVGSDTVDRALGIETTPGHARGLAGGLLERAAAVLPVLATAQLARVYLGVRPIPADGVTVAGPLPGLANAYVAVTHSGVTLGPLLGRLLAGEIAGGEPSPLLAPFRPDRFASVPR